MPCFIYFKSTFALKIGILMLIVKLKGFAIHGKPTRRARAEKSAEGDETVVGDEKVVEAFAGQVS